MAANNLTNSTITWSEIKMFTGFGTVVVTVVMAWASLKADSSLMVQKTDNMIQRTESITKRVETLADKQDEMANSLTRLQTTIDDAKARGLLTQAQTDKASKAYLASVPPNQTSGSQKSMAIIADATTQSLPSPTITPTPTPNKVLPTMPSLIPTLLNLIGRN